MQPGVAGLPGGLQRGPDITASSSGAGASVAGAGLHSPGPEAPAAVPPLPPPVGDGDGGRGWKCKVDKAGPYPKWFVGVGYIRFREAAHSMDAHCDQCKLKTDKKTYGGRCEAQGRPLGYCLLVLQKCPGTMKAHRAWIEGWRLVPDEAYPERRKLRQTAVVDPMFEELLAAEEREPLPATDDEIGEPFLMP